MDKAEKVFEKIANVGKFVRYFDDLAEGAGRYLKSVPGKMKEMGRGVLKSDAAQIAGVFGAGLIVSQFVEELINHLKSKAVKAREPKYFRKMIESNPRLMEADPREVAALWGTLFQTAPNLAQDPVAAGAFIIQSINKEVLTEHGGPPIDTYKTLIDIEKGKRKDTGDKAWNAASKFIDVLGK